MTVKAMEKTKAKKTGKTYAVYGLMEWVALLPVGGSVVRIPFTGGSISGYGVKPATFTTDNEVLQRLIENSRHFRSGKIRVRP